jgi:hypothetical protein
MEEKMRVGRRLKGKVVCRGEKSQWAAKEAAAVCERVRFLAGENGRL